MKSPESATKINEDIDSLKKGMADTEQEITQVKDQVAQLKRLALVQDNTIQDLRQQIWNLTVSDSSQTLTLSLPKAKLTKPRKLVNPELSNKI